MIEHAHLQVVEDKKAQKHLETDDEKLLRQDFDKLAGESGIKIEYEAICKISKEIS